MPEDLFRLKTFSGPITPAYANILATRVGGERERRRSCVFPWLLSLNLFPGFVLDSRHSGIYTEVLTTAETKALPLLAFPLPTSSSPSSHPLGPQYESRDGYHRRCPTHGVTRMPKSKYYHSTAAFMLPTGKGDATQGIQA